MFSVILRARIVIKRIHFVCRNLRNCLRWSVNHLVIYGLNGTGTIVMIYKYWLQNITKTKGKYP